MKLKEFFRLLQLNDKKYADDFAKEAIQLVARSTPGRELARRAQKENKPLSEVIAATEPAAVLSKGAVLSTVIYDPSVNGFSAILDGKQRLAWLFLLSQHGRISLELELPVIPMDCGPEASDLSESGNFINPAAIRRYLKTHWQVSEAAPREEVISHFVRRIVRHLAAPTGNSRHATESALLAVELSRYLPQVKLAEVLNRSEAWVSSVLLLKDLKAEYLTALQEGGLSLSNALIIAQSGDSDDRSLLYELATTEKFSSRSLRVALHFLRLNSGFARRKDALKSLLKLLQERLVTIRENYFARLKLMFRNGNPLYQVRFFHKKDAKAARSDKDKLQTVSAVNYRTLAEKLAAAEAALATFPL